MACFHCGLAGIVAPEFFPQRPGLWDRACPACERMTVWVTEPHPKDDDDSPARAAQSVEDYVAGTFKRGSRRNGGAGK